MLNKVILQGRLCKDPEARQTTSGISVSKFDLAVERDKKDKDGNRRADFFPVVCYYGTADSVNQYCRKGDMVNVSGILQNRSWEGSDGKRHSITEIAAKEVYFLSKKKKQDSESDEEGFMPVDDNSDLPF